MEFKLTDKITEKNNIIYLIKDKSMLSSCQINEEEEDYILEKLKNNDKYSFTFNKLTHYQIILFVKNKTSIYKTLENLRKEGDKAATFLNNNNQETTYLYGIKTESHIVTAFAEGLILGNYKFLQYKSDKKPNSLKTIHFISEGINKDDFNELKALTEAVYFCRNMVNTPVQELQAVDFAKKVTELCKPLGVKTEIFNKSKIASLKMAGLMAVNKGSSNEPAFIQLEWHPENSKNEKPIVLVGKGIMFDTGGLSLKPPSAMEDMKADMAGAAVVSAAMYVIAKRKLPVHVIGIIPATDNQPGNNAIAPGDIIKMSNGVTVEILNTDAEGRLVLADALCYASNFKPSLVIDIATLTGSAERAIGKHGMVGVESGAEKQMEKIKEAGMETYERIAQMPFWDEYDKEIESDIADIQNIGKSINAGAITAGKILSRFINYPWIHLDIAGVAFMDKKESYVGKGASGIGVRLLYKFIKNYSKECNHK